MLVLFTKPVFQYGASAVISLGSPAEQNHSVFQLCALYQRMDTAILQGKRKEVQRFSRLF